jgi:hypothetical protein
MGRTVKSFRMVIENEFGDIDKFAKALRKQDREILEQILVKARLHTQAGTYGSFLDPFQAIVLGIVIEQQKMIRELHARNPY